MLHGTCEVPITGAIHNSNINASGSHVAQRSLPAKTEKTKAKRSQYAQRHVLFAVGDGRFQQLRPIDGFYRVLKLLR